MTCKIWLLTFEVLFLVAFVTDMHLLKFDVILLIWHLEAKYYKEVLSVMVWFETFFPFVIITLPVGTLSIFLLSSMSNGELSFTVVVSGSNSWFSTLCPTLICAGKSIIMQLVAFVFLSRISVWCVGVVIVLTLVIITTTAAGSKAPCLYQLPLILCIVFFCVFVLCILHFHTCCSQLALQFSLVLSWLWSPNVYQLLQQRALLLHYIRVFPFVVLRCT